VPPERVHERHRMIFDGSRRTRGTRNFVTATVCHCPVAESVSAGSMLATMRGKDRIVLLNLLSGRSFRNCNLKKEAVGG
jgi:hypothetical protein